MFSENVELTGGDLVLLDGVRLGVERFHILDEAPGNVSLGTLFDVATGES
jgi:hypothetical protein